MKIAFLTGSRSEWGYIRPILQGVIADDDLEYGLIVTNMHLSPTFGSSVREIERDGFEIAERIHMVHEDYTGLTMTKSLAVLLSELPSALERISPDVLLLAGDRGEQFMGAIAGIHMGIPVAHIQCGELSGNVDGIVRHAITKLAHLHFAANEEFAERVRKLGEETYRVHVTGAPLLDELVEGEFESPAEMAARFHLDMERPLILAVQHSVTEEEEAAGQQIEETLAALSEIGAQTLFVSPNSDAGSRAIRERLARIGNGNFQLVRNLPRSQYLGMLNMASVIVGNSSSGIMEASTFGTPCVNIGRRQCGRLQSSHVINARNTRKDIEHALRRAMSDEFSEQARQAINPYGQGGSAKRILQILKNTQFDERLFNKELAY